MVTRKKTGGGKLTRSEVVTIRLDPKVRYFLEIVARSERRTVSNYIECAIALMLRGARFDPENDGVQVPTRLVDLEPFLWDVHPADRLLKLNKHLPQFLSIEEERILKIIENDYENLSLIGRHDLEKIREQWDEICEKAENL